MTNSLRVSVAIGATLLSLAATAPVRAADPASATPSAGSVGRSPPRGYGYEPLPPAIPAGTEEIQKLVGSWRVVENVRGGRKNPRPEKIIITPTLLVYPARAEGHDLGLQMNFRVDPSQSPKALDCREIRRDFAPIKPAIYELAGSTLRLCFGEQARLEFLAERPDAFRAEQGMARELFVLERCPNVSTLPEKPATDVDAELAKTINDAIALLERKEYQAFLDTVFVPREKPLKAAGTKTGRFDETLLIFRAARRLTPTLNDDRSIATFDLTKYHIEGVESLNLPSLRMIRSNDRWVWDQK